MRKREISVMNVGVSLIILIFMDICLAAFAVLSLQNSLSDYSLSKKTATHTTEYYNAVNKVQEQLADKNEELQKQWEIQQAAEKKKAGRKVSQKKGKKTQDIQQTKTKKNKVSQQEIQSKATKTKQIKEIKITESVSKRQQLVVTLQLDETGTYPQYYIEKWQLCSPEDWQADESLDVYKSGE